MAKKKTVRKSRTKRSAASKKQKPKKSTHTRTPKDDLEENEHWKPCMGRRHSLVADDKTLQTIHGLAQINCTQKEAAAVLHVHADTFSAFLKKEELAREAWGDANLVGKASLRRLQFTSAKNGNVTMQIWLGKQLLGQKDRQELTGANNGPIEHRDVSAREIITSRIAGIASRNPANQNNSKLKRGAA